MTLLAEPKAPANSESEVPVPPPSPPRVISVRQILVVSTAAILLFLLGMFLLEDPVAHLWFNARQHQRIGGWTQQRRTTRIGQTLAVIQIREIGLNVPVVEGDSVDLLRGGPGHAPASPLPGKIGNSVIFGHRKGWGGPFGKLGQVQTGNVIYLQLFGQSDVLAFNVAQTQVVGEGQERALLAPSNDRRLTLVTAGTGGRFSGKYLVISAVSGNPGTLSKDLARATHNPGSGSILFNRAVGLLLLRVAGVILLVALLRRRYRPGVVATLASPLVLASLLALFLNVDRLLAPLG